MAAHPGEVSHRLDHARRDVPRMGAGEADPLQAIDGVQPVQQFREVAFAVVGRLVMIDDLAEELNLFRAGVDRLPGLGEDGGDGTHPLVPSRVGNDAEGAELVAALDDGDVGLEGVAAASDAERERDVVKRVDFNRRASAGAALGRLRHEHRQALDVLSADDDVDHTRTGEDRRPLLLRDAARDGDDRTSAGFDSLLPDLAEAREQLLLRPLPHAARVDDDDVRLVVARGFLVASLFEQARHALGVVHVHLAAVGLDEILHGRRFRFRFCLLFVFRLPPGRQHFPGTGADAGRDLGAAYHPGELLLACRGVEPLHPG